MAEAFYLTTTLPYVNAEPHIGFAFEIVQADIVARYKRMMGGEVFFSTGTDEHGQKIFQKAREEGRDVVEYVEYFAAQFETLRSGLDLSYDAFVRTTSPSHIKAAQALWARCAKNGDIYKKRYRGLYCIGDEAFIRESDLVKGRCPNHPAMEPVAIEEENYFFRLSAYAKRLLEYLTKEDPVLPDWRREEAIRFVEAGLEDFSISREKARMSWGVPVPGDDSQVMYVWFDALTNYISTLGWPDDTTGNFERFWQNGEVVQVAGKDQVRFQSIMWQAMLMSGQIKNTDKVVYHGFITSGGQKMSKSLGNVIEPLALTHEYGIDPLRLFLSRHTHPFEDSDFTLERFKEVYNSDLANGLGNLVSRIMQLAQTNLMEAVRPQPKPFPPEYLDAFGRFEINRAADYVWTRIAALNQRISDTAPFKLVKTEPARAQSLIAELAAELYFIASMLSPFMPNTSKRIELAVASNEKPENLFPRKD
jgi:methionyl-tRNA synthetase